MTWLVLTNSSPGATRNSGTNGDLCTLLDWALPQAGWAIEYSSGNARVYRPGTGNRFRLHVNHDSAVSTTACLATVRGCESASGATTLTDPFPTVALAGNNVSNWMVSSVANTTDRPFHIYLSETFVYYCSNYSGAADVWEFGFFGDVSPQLTDSYNTVCGIRNLTALTLGMINCQVNATSPGGNGRIWWVRDITGATKSSMGNIYASGTSFGANSAMPVSRGGYQNRIYREKVAISDGASTSVTPSVLCVMKRGWLPNIWNGLHNGRGAVSEADTFTDTAYNPSATFRMITNTTSNFIIIEETDTWSPP